MSRSTNTDGLMALLAEPLVVYGPRKTDAHASRTDALVAMRALIDDGGKDKRMKVASARLAVTASPTGRSAWAVDIVTVDGAPLAVTAVLSNEDDFWVVTAASLARQPSKASVKAQLAKAAIVPPAAAAPGKIDSAADGAVEQFKRGAADPAQWVTALAAHDDAVWIGAASGELSRGPKAIAALAKKRAKQGARYTLAGDLAASTTHDGALAWVTSPAVRFADGDDALPLRLFAIYARDRSGWSLVALQESVAVDEPGGGASFMKISAPRRDPHAAHAILGPGK